MRVYVIFHPSATWYEDYAVAVIAESKERAIELARNYSPDFKNAADLMVEVHEVDREHPVLAANVGA